MRYFIFFILVLPGLFSCGEQPDREEAMAYLENTRTFIEEDQLEEARVEATKAKALFQELRDTQHMAEALYLESRVYALQGKFEAAADQGAQAQRYAQRAGDLELEYQINNILSWSYFSLGQSFSENLAHQERQLAVVGRLDDNAAKALVYNNYGYDATVAGTVPLDTAVRYSGWANQYYARTEGHQGRWYTLMNLTWQYRLQNKLTESEQWGRLALSQAQADADRHAIIEAATNMGRHYSLPARSPKPDLFTKQPNPGPNGRRIATDMSSVSTMHATCGKPVGAKLLRTPCGRQSPFWKPARSSTKCWPVPG